jgi:hypothetical protein
MKMKYRRRKGIIPKYKFADLVNEYHYFKKTATSCGIIGPGFDYLQKNPDAMLRLLLMLMLGPLACAAQGIYASLDASMSHIETNGTVVVGYHNKGWHVGLGTGMSRVTFQNSFIKSYGLYHPVFAEAAYLSPRRKVSPYAAIRAGLLMSGRNGVFASPIDIDGSYMGAAKLGVAVKRKSFYFIPFALLLTQSFDKAGSRNVGVTSKINCFGAGVNLIFY